MTNICCIPECARKVKGHNLCNRHYIRWRKYGDPLAGGTFWGEPEAYIREVVLCSNTDDCVIWPFSRDKR